MICLKVDSFTFVCYSYNLIDYNMIN